MSLTITSRIVSGVVIVDVSGRLRFLEVALYPYFNDLLEKGHRNFVLNLSHVPYIDSFGLGQLIRIWTSIKSTGGHLILLQPTNHVRELLQITKLNTLFHISGEEAEALTDIMRMDFAASA